MEFLLLIYEAESDRGSRGESERAEVMDAYRAFSQSVADAGVLRGANALQPVSDGTTVRVRDGAAMLTDGPFAETKEQLGGYYLLDCPDLAAALAWAEKIPTAKTGSVEVRPIMTFE